MEARGVFPNVATFTALIVACGAIGDTQRAFDSLSRMEALGLQPNTYTFNALIACCARA